MDRSKLNSTGVSLPVSTRHFGNSIGGQSGYPASGNNAPNAATRKNIKNAPTKVGSDNVRNFYESQAHPKNDPDPWNAPSKNEVGGFDEHGTFRSSIKSAAVSSVSSKVSLRL